MGIVYESGFVPLDRLPTTLGSYPEGCPFRFVRIAGTTWVCTQCGATVRRGATTQGNYRRPFCQHGCAHVDADGEKVSTMVSQSELHPAVQERGMVRPPWNVCWQCGALTRHNKNHERVCSKNAQHDIRAGKREGT